MKFHISIYLLLLPFSANLELAVTIQELAALAWYEH